MRPACHNSPAPKFLYLEFPYPKFLYLEFPYPKFLYPGFSYPHEGLPAELWLRLLTSHNSAQRGGWLCLVPSWLVRRRSHNSVNR